MDRQPTRESNDLPLGGRGKQKQGSSKSKNREGRVTQSNGFQVKTEKEEKTSGKTRHGRFAWTGGVSGVVCRFILVLATQRVETGH